MSLRFVIQPLLASIIAIRGGLKDAKAARPAYLWKAVTCAEHRAYLLYGGLKDLLVPISVGVTLDVVYQVIVHKWVYPLETVFTVTLLVLVPYLLLRGPVNRLACQFRRKESA